MNAATLLSGSPRSGTSWIGGLFDSRPDSFYRSESDGARSSQVRVFPGCDNAPRRQPEMALFLVARPDARANRSLRHPCGYVASVVRGEAMGQFDVEGSHDDCLWPLKTLLAIPASVAHGPTPKAAARMVPQEQPAWFRVSAHGNVVAGGTALQPMFEAAS